MKTRVQPRHFSTFDPKRPKQRMPRALLQFQCSELERIVKFLTGSAVLCALQNFKNAPAGEACKTPSQTPMLGLRGFHGFSYNIR